MRQRRSGTRGRRSIGVLTLVVAVLIGLVGGMADAHIAGHQAPFESVMPTDTGSGASPGDRDVGTTGIAHCHAGPICLAVLSGYFVPPAFADSGELRIAASVNSFRADYVDGPLRPPWRA